MPFSTVSLQEAEEVIWCDAFKLFKSSHRVHVEQAFGMLINRFGILWGLCCLTSVVPQKEFQRVLYFTNHREQYGSSEADISQEEHEDAARALERCWKEAQRFRFAARSGARSDLQQSCLRRSLVRRLKDVGLTRP